MKKTEIIDIKTNIKTTLVGMDKVISDMEAGLKNQKFDVSKNTNLSKLIKQYKDAKEELDSLTSSGFIRQEDVKKVVNLGDKISKTYRQIGSSFRQIQEGEDSVLKTLFPANFSTQIAKATKEINNFFSNLENKEIKNKELAKLTADLKLLDAELDKVENKRIKVEIDADKEKTKKILEEIEKQTNQLQNKIQIRLTPEEPKNAKGLSKEAELEAKVKSTQESYSKAVEKSEKLTQRALHAKERAKIDKLQQQLIDQDGISTIAVKENAIKEIQEELGKRATRKASGKRGQGGVNFRGESDQDLRDRITTLKTELIALNNVAKQIEDIERKPKEDYEANKKVAEANVKRASTNLEKAEEELRLYKEQREAEIKLAESKAESFIKGEAVAEATDSEREALKKLNAEKERQLELQKQYNKESSFQSQEDKDLAIEAKKTEIAGKKISIDKINKSLKDLNQSTDIEELFKKLEALDVPLTNIEHSTDGLKQLKENLNNLDSKTAETIRKELEKLGFSADQTKEFIEDLSEELAQIKLDETNFIQARQEIEDLKNQVKYFFSLTNTIDLFKRTVNSALQTVRELDKVMTETATVTEFSIGDMWDKLPVYSRNASQLGASIRDLYSATTLYYQQGLKTNEAMSVGIETMKMARIANMDAKDATTAMTAALRGFNMEINEVSAQRINDVYSELAAITAADTSQIAAAMTKTASIASSANMEFETTAALLAQIIETTQEAPETAGTAMKTIIARFTEVKELFSEGVLTGTDEEGESIDINKIDTALKTVGISLKDFLNGTKGIDDIFLELASKWDSLDLATQRYIATTAAGSRQQSRFIAMMSNYERTMELVDAANTSAGASAEQFDKTLESMEAKLQRLKNAWDEFAMGLANNELLKFGVDLLTGFLNTVNAITSGISGENGLIKSVVNLATVLGLLKGGSTLIGSFFKEKTISGSIVTADGQEGKISFSLGGLAGQKEGEQTGKAFVKGVKTAIENAEKGKKLKAGIVSLFGNLEYEDVKVGERVIKSKLNDKAQLALSERRGYLDRQVEGGHILEKETQEDSVLKQIEDFGKKLEDLNEEDLTEEVLKKAEELGISLEEINESIVVKKVKSYSLNLNAMGVAALGAARGIDLLSNYMKEIGKNDFAEKLDTISQTLSVVGSGALVASQAFQALGVSVKASSAGLAIGAKIFSYAQVGLFAAGIMGVVLAFTALQNAWKEWSPEGQLKKANKYLEQTSTMASEAAQRYNEVATGLEDLEKRTGSLKELSKGTREWREQVYELNSEVLNLIEKYPDLRSFLDNDGELLVLRETDANGQTLDSVLENLEKTKYNTQAAKIEAGINVQERQNDIYYSQLGDSAKRKINLENANDSWRTISEEEKSRILAQGSIVSMNTTEGAWAIEMAKSVQESTEELARKIASGDLEAREIAEQEGLDISALTDFGRKLLESDKAIEAFTQSLISAAQANADVPEKYEDALDGAFTTDYATKLKEGYEQDILTAKDDELINYQKQYADNMGYEYIKGKFYSGQGADRKEVVIPHELLAKELAAQMASGQITEQTEKLVGALPKFKGTIFERIVAESEGGKLTREDLGALDGLFDEDGNPIMNKDGTKSKVAELYEDWGLSKEIIPLQQFFEMILSASSASQRAADTDSKLSKMGLTEKGIDFNKLSIGSAESIVNNLFDVFAVSGEKATEDLAVRLNNIIEHENLSLEQTEIFAQTLGEIDWTDTNSIESFSVSLEEAGFTAWDLVGDIEGLEDEMAIAAHAVAKFNMDNIAEQIKSFENLTKDISEREEYERTFTAEEKADMLKYNPVLADQFIQTGEDEWTYIGESMNGLVIALQENTRAMIEANGGEATHYYSQMDPSDIISQTGTFGDLTTTEDLEARDQALTAMIATQKGLQAEYNATIKAMGGFDKVSKKEQMLIKASILNANEYSKKLAKVAEVLNDNSDALDKSNKGTEVYQRAIDEVTEAAQEVFGENITAEFVEENIELFRQWGQGVEGSANKIRQKMLENQTIIEGFGENAETVKTIIDQLQDAEFDIYGRMDATEIFSSLGEVQAVASEVAEDLKKLGFSVEVEQVEAGSYWTVIDGIPTQKPLYGYKVKIVDDFSSQMDFNKTKHGSSGGGGGNKYENSQEKFYNQYEKINSLLRERESIERQYNRLLAERIVNGQDLLENNQAQIDILREQVRIQEELRAGKTQQISDLIATNSQYSNYITGFDYESGIIEINWDAINAITDVEEGEAVEKFLSLLEGLRDQLLDIDEAIVSIDDQVQEILLQGKDEYFDLEEQIKEAIVTERQEEIDKLTTINDTINESNSRLIESMQNAISKERQARQNEETERDLSDKRRRLAYLQQDTSGANALEIMQLQEEIRQDEQDYTDNLIDQKIALLQEQNDKAAEQRERQIEIMRLQLDQYISSGAIWEEVSRLWETGITDVGTLVEGSRLQQILENAAEITGLSSLSQEEWRQNLARSIAEAFGYVNGKRRASNGQEVTFTTADNQTLTGIADEQGNITVDGKTYTEVYQNQRGDWMTSEKHEDSVAPDINQEAETDVKKPPELTENDKIGISAAIWNGGQGWGDGDTRAARLKEIFGDNDIQKNYVDKYKVEGFTGEVSDYSYEKMKNKYTAFKTGGLVDFTGPAWLDGTKTKPEYILNARQTEGFFRLIDILGSLNLNDSGTQAENHGDNFIDIDINIETVKEEADVDMLAEKLRGAIIEGATYRNNTSIRR